MKDLIILGAGPAGMSAAIYAARKKMDFSIIASGFGGNMALASEVDNYPGLRNIPGYEIAVKMKEHLKSYGVKIEDDTIEKIERKGKTFILKSKSKTYECETLIIATGRKARELTSKNADKFKGKGISYCATCDAPLFAGKAVAVVGGGNSAMDAVMQLSKHASKIYLLVRRDELKADKMFAEKALKHCEVKYLCEIEEFSGKDFLSEIIINLEGKRETLKVDGVFSEIGWKPNSDLIDFADKTEKGEIKADNSCRTSVEGLFAAGDVTDSSSKQMITAAGLGATALISAYNYLNKQ